MADWTPPEASGIDDWAPPDIPRDEVSPPEPGTEASTTPSGVAAATARGLSPYATGAIIGATAGSVVPGIGTATGGAIGAGMVGLTDLGISMYNPVAEKMGLPRAKSVSDITNDVLTKLGIKQPQTPTERIVQRGSESVGGALSSAGLAKYLSGMLAPGTVRQGVAASLAKDPKGQMISAGLGGTAAQATAEAGGGPLAQFAANIAASMAPGMAGRNVRSLSQGKSTPEQVQTRIDESRAVGVSPDVAQVAPSMMSRSAIKALQSTETMEKRVNDVNNALEAEANRIANKVGKVQNPNAVGRILQEDLGKEGFGKRVAAVESKLWNKWWDTATKNGAGGKMPMSNTLDYLKRNQQTVEGAEMLSEWMRDKQLGGILKAFEQDLSPKTSKIVGPDGKPMVMADRTGIPYEAVKHLRTVVGEKLDPTNMAPDVSRSNLKGLYASLTRDMENYAKILGPQAEKDFKRANMVTRGKMDRLENYISEIQKKTPAQVWRYAVSPESIQDGGHQFLAINRSLSPEARDTFHATFISKMGMDKNGEFNPEQFTQRYKNLPPAVRGAVFPPEQRAAVDRLTRVIGDLERGGSLKSKTDNTPHVGAYIIMGALMHAHPQALMTVALASAKSEKLAQFLTNPKVIQHLAATNNMSATDAAKYVNAFADYMKHDQSGDE